MRGYKSLMMVTALGGVLLVLAGVLVSTEAAGRKKADGDRKRAGKAQPAAITLRVPASGAAAAADPTPGLAQTLDRLRDTFASSQAPVPARLEELRAATNRLAFEVNPADWPVLEAELRRPDPPRGYRALVLVLAGSCRNPAALPAIAAHIGEHPTKVVEALKRNGGSDAFRTIVGLFDAAGDEGLRLLLLEATKDFELPEATPFLVRVLADEKAKSTLEAAVTLSRFRKNDAMLNALVGFAMARGPGESAILKRALNSLSGLAMPEASGALLEFAVGPDAPPHLREAASEALCFHKDPALLPVLADRVLAAEGPLPAFASRFAERNARPETVPALRRLLERASGEDATRLRGALERLLAAGAR